MTHTRLLFDECIGKPHIDRLADFVAIDGDDAPQIKHILEFQEQGVWDEEWIPRIANEEWIVITQDLGRKARRAKGAPLPELCLSHDITHVLLSPRVGKRKSFDKMLTILSVWREMLSLAHAPKGSRYVLEPHSSAEPDATLGKLVNRTPEPKRPPPGQLFDPESE